jgi:putative Ca2+/H+ antiporter (TMEM165/GDT1 family)
MELKLFATGFGTIFITEMADKTQLVMLLFAAD